MSREVRKRKCIGVGAYDCSIQTANAAGRCNNCLDLAEQVEKCKTTKRRLYGRLGEDRPRAQRLGRAAKALMVTRSKYHGSFEQ